MTIEELNKAVEELRQQFEKFTIRGPGVSGDSRSGFRYVPPVSGPITPVQSSGAGLVPMTPVGACCFPDGSGLCHLLSFDDCLATSGNQYHGDGTPCGPLVCCIAGAASFVTVNINVTFSNTNPTNGCTISGTISYTGTIPRAMDGVCFFTDSGFHSVDTSGLSCSGSFGSMTADFYNLRFGWNWPDSPDLEWECGANCAPCSGMDTSIGVSVPTATTLPWSFDQAITGSDAGVTHVSGTVS